MCRRCTPPPLLLSLLLLLLLLLFPANAGCALRGCRYPGELFASLVLGGRDGPPAYWLSRESCRGVCPSFPSLPILLLCICKPGRKELARLLARSEKESAEVDETRF